MAMTRYLALLRGINVGGHHRVAMANLREMFLSLGFENVSTYIQSGNAIFETEDARPDELVEMIQRRLQADLGYGVAVILRDAESLGRAVEKHLFTEEELSGDYRCWVIFFPSAPDTKDVADLAARQTELERFHVQDREVYMALHKDVPAGTFRVPVERILKMPGTSRNWTVTQKLAELLARA